MEGMTKESLANEPQRYLLKHIQIWINIGFDLDADELMLKYLGINVDNIPKLELTNLIYKHLEVDSSTRHLIRK